MKINEESQSNENYITDTSIEIESKSLILNSKENI